MLKPHAEIYERLCEKFDLKAEECLFVDDTKINAEGAVAAGLRGFHFTGDADALRKAIREMGANI